MGNPIKQIQKMVNGVATNITPLTDDNIKPADVINSLTSTAIDKPLSAKMGCELNTRIDNISQIGRYLAGWDCTTGLPTSTPPGGVPYAYKSGDYYIIAKVVNKLEHPEDKNYMPTTGSYDGNPSTVVDTQDVVTSYLYYYDGNVWTMIAKQTDHIRFGSLVGEPRESIPLAQEFDKYILKLPKETFSGLEYQFPFNINPLVQESDKITTSFDTLVLNDGTTRGHFDMAIPLADPTNNKAGLWNKSLSDLVDIAVECNTEYYTLSGSVTPEQYAALKTCKMARVTITVSGYEIGKALATVYFDATPPGEMIKMFSALNPFQDGSRQFSGAYLTINDGANIAGHIRYYGNDIEVQPLGYVGVTDIYGMKFNGTEYNFGVKKVGDTTVGSSTKPIYLDAGTPTVCDHEINTGAGLEKIISTDTTTTSADTTVYTSLKVDGLLASKSTVTYNQIVTTGTKIAEISINGTSTDIYAPTGGSGTLTGIKMNGSAVTITGGIADLGTVITAHQDISGKQDALSTAQLSAVNSGINSTKVATYDGYATQIAAKSTVGVAASGTSTNEVNYISIDGTEYKLPSGGSSSTTVTAVIETTWTASGEFYIQDITVTGMTSTENPIVSVVYDGTTKALVESQQTEAAKVVKIIADTDKITVYAKEQTTVALTILVKRV